MGNCTEITIIASPACMRESEWECDNFFSTVIYPNKVKISALVTLWSQRSQITREKRLKEKGHYNSQLYMATMHKTTCSCCISETHFLNTETRFHLPMFNNLQYTDRNNAHSFSAPIREIPLHLNIKNPQNWRRKCQKYRHYKFALVNFGVVLHTRKSFLRKPQTGSALHSNINRNIIGNLISTKSGF